MGRRRLSRARLSPPFRGLCVLQRRLPPGRPRLQTRRGERTAGWFVASSREHVAICQDRARRRLSLPLRLPRPPALVSLHRSDPNSGNRRLPRHRSTFCRKNEGKGLIWRLYSAPRFEERDGGVYIELEALALSRDIPAGLHWMIEPIVRRVSRSSLATALQQTQSPQARCASIAGR